MNLQKKPTNQPTSEPTENPTLSPSEEPTSNPTSNPTSPPTTQSPTSEPTPEPTDVPCFNGGNFCGGNGNCIAGVCNCTSGFAGADCTRLSTPPVVPDCFNGGNFCGGNGYCVNSACQCQGQWTGPSCTTSTKPKISCDTFSNYLNGSAVNCSVCLAFALDFSISCAWCSQSTLDTQYLTNGTCVGPSDCPVTPLITCPEISPFIPPSCPDNCSYHGICVNISNCSTLNYNNRLQYGNDTSKWPLSCGANLFISISRGYNSTCACYQGFSGINCGNGKYSFAALASIGGGIVALIVIIICVVVCATMGGTAFAISTTYSTVDDGTVVCNPLYIQKAVSRDVGLGEHHHL